VLVVPGTWCITVTGSVSTCPPPAVPRTYELVFTQAADALIATRGAVTYTGSLCGSTGAMTGSDPALSTVYTITFAGDPAGIASGVASWSGGGCSGTDTFAASPGACP
jgi:hypothetical protein